MSENSSLASNSCVTIRAYEPRDFDAITRMFKDGMYAHEAHQKIFNDPTLGRMVEEMLQKDIDGDLSHIDEVYVKPGGFYWVATTPSTKGERVVGMVALENKGNGVGELRRMSVHQDYRRTGLGRKLVAELEKWAKEQGYRKVMLGTGSTMEMARKFYESQNYILKEIVPFDREDVEDTKHIEGAENWSAHMYEKEL